MSEQEKEFLCKVRDCSARTHSRMHYSRVFPRSSYRATEKSLPPPLRAPSLLLTATGPRVWLAARTYPMARLVPSSD